MATILLAAGAAMCAISFGGRHLIRRMKLNRMRTKGLANDPALIERYKLAFEDPMNRREAALILGVSSSATEQEIHQAYKNLIMLNHPDIGGSSYLAMKINHAKDLMLIK
jgi:DnaJ-domain-containing protein 1